MNEEGTEAAAATEVGIVLESAPMILDFVADQPFAFTLISNNQNLLFNGIFTG